MWPKEADSLVAQLVWSFLGLDITGSSDRRGGGGLEGGGGGWRRCPPVSDDVTLITPIRNISGSRPVKVLQWGSRSISPPPFPSEGCLGDCLHGNQT